MDIIYIYVNLKSQMGDEECDATCCSENILGFEDFLDFGRFVTHSKRKDNSQHIERGRDSGDTAVLKDCSKKSEVGNVGKVVNRISASVAGA